MAESELNITPSDEIITVEDLAEHAAGTPGEIDTGTVSTPDGETFLSRPSAIPISVADQERKPPSASSPVPPDDSVDKSKVDLLLKAVGDAPIMKKKRWAVEPTKKVAWVSEFVRKYLKCEPNESLFLYVNQYFSPSPDQEIGSLYECFGSDGKLVLHYCKQQAWG